MTGSGMSRSIMRLCEDTVGGALYGPFVPQGARGGRVIPPLIPQGTIGYASKESHDTCAPDSQEKIMANISQFCGIFRGRHSQPSCCSRNTSQFTLWDPIQSLPVPPSRHAPLVPPPLRATVCICGRRLCPPGTQGRSQNLLHPEHVLRAQHGIVSSGTIVKADRLARELTPGVEMLLKPGLFVATHR